MPIEPPTDADRLRFTADLRRRAVLVRENGWSDYDSIWPAAELAGVRGLLDEAAVSAACPLWAPRLWGVTDAETDAAAGYQRTRRWFAGAANPQPPQLTDDERARWTAAKAAVSDLATGLVEGYDSEAIGAALSAARQGASGLDMARVRDAVHVPGDAGEHTEALRAILLRIPDGWGRWISCDRGWYTIVVELDQGLAAIDPTYTVQQVKEKYAGHRFYFHTDRGDLWDQMNAAVRFAEERAGRTCERCGAPGVLHQQPSGWMKTLCGSCAAEIGGYGPVAR